MKTIRTLFATVALLTAAAPAARAEVRVSVDFFYDNLDPYGTWREVGDYGYCWQPRDVDRDWQPYTDGRWVYTDAGWTWDSDEPYSWAVYHYGRWAFVEDTGWIWVPDTQWGPGWVSWRHSSDYVGWAPLPPEARFIISVGFSSWVDNYYDIGPRNYRFVEIRDFGERRLRSRFVDPRQNITIIQNTTNITNITYVDSVVHNGGPRFEEVASLSSQPIQRFRLERQQQFEGNAGSQRDEMFRSRQEGNALRVFAPPIELRASAAPKRLAERIDQVAVNHGWQDAGTGAEVQQLRFIMKSQDPPPSELPPQPKFQKPVMQQGSELPGKRGPTQTVETPPSSTGRPRVDGPPSAPGTEPGPARMQPVLPVDEPNRRGTLSNSKGETPRQRPEGTPKSRILHPTPAPGIPNPVSEVPRVRPQDTPPTRMPDKRPDPSGVRDGDSQPQRPQGTPKSRKPDPLPAPGIPNPVSEVSRVRPQDTPPTRMPDKKPDLSGVRERDGKPQGPEGTPKSRMPRPMPAPGDNPPPRPIRPETPSPDIRPPTPSPHSKKAAPPSDERPAIPPAPLPQSKPQVSPQPPVNQPQTTPRAAPIPVPTPEPDQPRQGKGKPKDKKKDDPDKN